MSGGSPRWGGKREFLCAKGWSAPTNGILPRAGTPFEVCSKTVRPRRLPDLVALSRWMLPVLDVAIVGSSAAIAALVLSQVRDPAPIWPLDERYQIGVMFALVLTPLVFHRLDLYRSHRGESLVVELTQVTAGWLAVLGILALIAIGTKTNVIFSRVWML